MLNKDKWLITIDLDGTFLRTDTGYYTEAQAHELNIKVINKLKELGHVVAIVTGRPWRDTKKIYEQLDLDTIVGNHNGAFIHHPRDPKFKSIETAINKDLFYDMLNMTDLGKSYANILIEYEDITYLLHDEPIIKKMFHVTEDSNYDIIKLTDVLPENPRSITFTMTEEADKNAVINQLKRKFGSAFIFRYWKDRTSGQVNLEVNQKHSTKASVMRLVASFYNIPERNTMAFGDGMNDIDMLSEAAVGVAMKNANHEVQGYAKDVTDYTNNEGGVGKYLIRYFDLDIDTEEE